MSGEIYGLLLIAGWSN